MTNSANDLIRATLCCLALVLGATGSAAAQSVGAYEVTAKGGLNVRSAPNTQGVRVGLLPEGSEVRVVGVSGQWAVVRFNGVERYVHGRYLRPASGAASSETYTLAGQDSKRGDYALVLSLTSLPGGGVQVTREATYADGKRETHSGPGSRQGDSIRAKLRENRGASGALRGDTRQSEVEVWIRLGADGAVVAKDRSPRGEGRAERAAVPLGTAQPERGRHLLAAASESVAKRIRKTAAGLAYDGIDLERTFQVSRFFHVGVGGAIKALRSSDLSASQVEGSRGQPRHVWLESRISGGVRVPLSTTIPAGEVTLALGFEVGARLDYTVVDLYPMPKGVTDVGTVLRDLRQATVRSFDLPLDATEAKAMTVGARRVFEGRAHVALSGSLSIGRELGTVGDVARIGASARVGGFYRISGRARIEVERLPRSRVRVRLTRAKTHTRGASADLFLGASLDHAGVRRELKPAVEYVDQALIDRNKLSPELRAALISVGEEVVVRGLDGVVRRLTRVTIKAAVTRTKEDELDLAFRFDLQAAKARQAYERAVRGDFTLAGRLALEPQSGVSLDHRVLEVERATHLAASLNLSVVLDASFSRRISLRDLSVEDSSGRTDYEIWRYEREFALNLLNRERKRKVDLEVVRRTRPGAATPDHSLRFRLEIADPSTWEAEARSFQRLLQWWGLDGSSNVPTRERKFLQPRFGATRTELEIRIADGGITKILAQDRAAYLEAYVKAYTVIRGRTPKWATEDGRRWVDAEDERGANNDRRDLDRARAFVRHLDRLGKARTQRQRASALKSLAGTARWDLYSMAALVSLAPRSEVSLDASLLGRRIRVVDGVRGATPVEVADPR
ncbi:MAG: SH3 domain-containing protein [Planctomycetes bacterium]|nr:SH3 domain-containing protein [Planctomycetota bacterium]